MQVRSRTEHKEVMRLKQFVPALIILLAISGGAMLAHYTNPQSNPADIRGFLWPNPPQLDPFVLDTSDGSPFTNAQLIDRWTLVFFGFTNCPDICPTTMSTLNQLHNDLSENPLLKEQLQVLFVSVDRERDTAEILDEYVGYFNPEFIGVTGSEESLENFAKQFGVLFMKVNSAGLSRYSMDHSASVLVVDPLQRFVGVFSRPHDVTEMRERLLQIVAFIEGTRT